MTCLDYQRSRFAEVLTMRKHRFTWHCYRTRNGEILHLIQRTAKPFEATSHDDLVRELKKETERSGPGIQALGRVG